MVNSFMSIAPAYDAIEYLETGLRDAFGSDEYIGQPSDRTEKAWKELWQRTSFASLPEATYIIEM